jgi:hypothetical protein
MNFLLGSLVKLNKEIKAMNVGAVNEIISSLRLKKWGAQIDDTILTISRQILLSDYDEAIQSINALSQSVESASRAPVTNTP